jgi:cell division protein FtsQ
MACLAASAWLVTNSQAFDLRALRVTGNVRLSFDDIARDAGLTGETNVLWLAANELERRLQANPWVLTAHVSRTLPSTVVVAVRERVAVAVLAGRPGLLVAGDGMVLGVAGGSDRLPLIQAPRRHSIGTRLSPSPQLAVARGIPASVRSLVARVFLDRSGGIRLAMRDGASVLFGDATEIAPKGRALKGLLSWVARRGVIPRYIDVRVPAAPAVRARSTP